MKTEHVEPSSPCIGVCKIDSDVCVGCLRTLEEIANWRSLSRYEAVERTKELLAKKAAEVPSRQV